MVQPFHDYVIIERHEEDNVSKSGLIITAEKKPGATGTVLRVSDEVEFVKKGDVVLFDKYSPLELEVNGEKIIFLRFEDIFGVME